MLFSRIRIGGVLLALTLSACSSTSTRVSGAHASEAKPALAKAPDLRSFFLPQVPAWAKSPMADDYFLDIDLLMEKEGLTRLEAVEVQNRMRDALEDPKVSIQDAFSAALKRIQEGDLESGWKPVVFHSPSEFVLVLGMEVKNVPRGQEFLAKVRQNPDCRGIVIFTDQPDAAALEALRPWKSKGLIDAIFTRNQLVMGKRSTGPVKDLRLVDPELRHVIIVDSDPDRVMQPKLMRALPRYEADRYAKAVSTGDDSLRRYYESLFGVIGEEINEAVKSANEGKIPFAQAYQPYTLLGERVLRVMERTLGSRHKALALLRLHPELQ